MTLNTPTNLTGGNSGTDSAVYTTASITAALDSRVLVVVTSGGLSGAGRLPTSVTHPTIGALTLVVSQAVPGSNGVLSVWAGVGTGSAGAFTITHASTQSNCLWQVHQFTSDNGTPEVAQTAVFSSSTGTTGSAVLAQTPPSTSCTVGLALLNLIDTETHTPALGFTLLGARRYQNSPTLQQHSAYDNTNPPASVAYTASTAGRRAIIALEIADAPAEAGLSAHVWNGTVEVPVSVTLWTGASEIPVTLE